jgi:serine/alanine adding enzyme
VLPLAHMKSRLFGSFLVSLPFFNYGGLLCNDDETASALLDEAGRTLNDVSADHAELRHLNIPRQGLATKEHKVTMILELEKDEEAQWKALDAKVRNQVRKAEKSGLTAITGHLDLLDGFYEVFCRNMRDLGTPVYGKDFFRNILETFPNTTRIISVMLGDKTVASGILTWFRDTLEVPWASSVSDHREKCPNNLLYW